MENEFKSCPYCGEKIRKEAKKCRFCGEWLTDDTRKAAEMKEKAEEKAELQKWLENRKAKRSGAGVMTVFLLILFFGMLLGRCSVYRASGCSFKGQDGIGNCFRYRRMCYRASR